MADITSESVADIKSECLADLLRITHPGVIAGVKLTRSPIES
jgi:hypothetical protein